MSILSNIFGKQNVSIKGIWEYIGDGKYSVNVNEKNILGLSAAYSCTRLLSETIAGLPVNIKKKTDLGYSTVSEHSAQRILRMMTNETLDSRSFKEVAMTTALNHGNHYSRIIRNGTGKVVKLVPFQHQDKIEVRIEPESDNIVYVYDKKQTFTTSEVFHIKGLTLDGYVGISVIEYFKTLFGTALSAQKYGHEFYNNGTALDGYIEVEASLDSEKKKNLREGWNRNYGGLGKSKTAVLDKGMKYHPLALKPEDAQYLQSKQFSKKEIATIYRVPPHMINEVTDAKYNSVEHLQIEFVNYSIMPWINRWETEVNNKLLAESEKADHVCKFNVNGLLRGDMKTRAEFYHSMKLDGNLSTNDIRELEDMNTIQGGDKYVWSLQTIPSEFAEDYGKSQVNGNSRTNGDG